MRTTCQRLEQLQSIRLPQEALATQQPGVQDLRTLTRTIINKELQQRDSPISEHDHCHTRPPGLRDTVREELSSVTVYAPTTSPFATIFTPSYSVIAARPFLQAETPSTQDHATAIAAAAPPPAYYSSMGHGRPRFISDGPVSFYCGIRGHIS